MHIAHWDQVTQHQGDVTQQTPHLGSCLLHGSIWIVQFLLRYGRGFVLGVGEPIVKAYETAVHLIKCSVFVCNEGTEN